MSWISEVIRFWFHDVDSAEWFGGAPEFDAAIRTRFGSLHDELKNNPPRPETLNAEGLVAAIVVFDQFSRNLFRDSAKAFATDSIALELSRYAIDRNLDTALETSFRHFLYMPFMHSEDPHAQARSMQLFERLGVPSLLNYAQQHKAIIDRFGRFPHRNAALGRQSTPTELDFLSRENH